MIARAHHWLKSIGCVELRCKLRNQACVGDPGLYICSYKAGRRVFGAHRGLRRLKGSGGFGATTGIAEDL